MFLFFIKYVFFKDRSFSFWVSCGFSYCDWIKVFFCIVLTFSFGEMGYGGVVF